MLALMESKIRDYGGSNVTYLINNINNNNIIIVQIWKMF